MTPERLIELRRHIALCDNDKYSWMGEMMQEIDRLQIIANRAGAWQTVDGVWVYQTDLVWYASIMHIQGAPNIFSYEAGSVKASDYKVMYSTRKKAAATLPNGCK
jgi:hypothetical protein